jgi:hypothetical protein
VIIGQPRNSQQGYFSFKEARSLVNVVRCTVPSYLEPAEPRSSFALALLMRQSDAQDVFAVRLDQRDLVLANRSKNGSACGPATRIEPTLQ